MNRIIQFLAPRECRCSVAKRQAAELKARCEAIEAVADGAFEFISPSARRLAGDLDEFDSEETAGDPPTVTLYITIEADRAPINCDLRAYAHGELVRIAEELLDAADKLEGGAK